MVLSGRNLILQILARLLQNEPLRQLFFANPDAALAAYRLGGSDIRFLRRIKDEDALQEAHTRLKTSPLMGDKESSPPSQATNGNGWEAAGPPQSTRVVNTGFADEAEPQTPLWQKRPLRPDTPYYFWLEVGEPVDGSIEAVPTPLPDDLPAEARLHVVLFAFAGELTLADAADMGELQLQKNGSVIVARDALVPPPLYGNNGLLNRRLFFPVYAPAQPGVYRLRCNIYYEQTLIQSRLVTAHVAPDEQPIDDALRSVLDYNLSHTLNGRHLQMMQHDLSILLNDNGRNTHGFRFLGRDGEGVFKRDTTLSEGKLQDLINQARSAYRSVAWQGGGPYQPDKKYRYAQNASLQQLKDDLVRLARTGYRLYAALDKDLAGERPEARRLEKLMRRSGQVQIAAKRDARLVVPAAIIYDYPLDSSLKTADYELCVAFVGALSKDAPLEDSPCFQGNCPTQEDLSTVCPSGFWGYRHALGLPLHIGDGPDTAVALPAGDAIELTIAVSTDPAFVYRATHEQALQGLVPGLVWTHADTRDEALDAMKGTSPHVLYFYCHGGLNGTIPYLLLGNPQERGITADNLRAYDIFWEEKRPLVFINGCHTAALEPQSAIDLVTAFVEESYAAGVIGTEITLFEPIAVAFAEECLRRFLVERQPLGTAVRGARLHLLKDRNPLGLIYIAYAMNSLQIIE